MNPVSIDRNLAPHLASPWLYNDLKLKMKKQNNKPTKCRFIAMTMEVLFNAFANSKAEYEDSGKALPNEEMLDLLLGHAPSFSFSPHLKK
jgi:hypothetical protein